MEIIDGGLDMHNHVRVKKKKKEKIPQLLLDNVFCNKYLTELRVCHYRIYYVVLPFNLLDFSYPTVNRIIINMM